jgi:hypothetical protein
MGLTNNKIHNSFWLKWDVFESIEFNVKMQKRIDRLK